MRAEEPASWMTAAEVAVWTVPTLATALLARRCPVGERRPWAFIAAICGVFAVDEIFDILGRTYHLVQKTARAIDPNAFRGETLVWRGVFLTLGAAVGLATMYLLFRGGRSSLPKWISFSGLCLVLVYIIFRLMPRIGELTEGPVGLGILAIAWCLLVGGALVEFERLRDR